MSIIKNGCICGGDYYTNTEQCNDPDCRSERKEKEYNDEFRQCGDCVHKFKESPCPCDSCEQNTPTNFEEMQ